MTARRLASILGAIVLMLAAAVVLGSAQMPAPLIATSMLRTMLQVATPLTLGALAGIYCERAGVINIAIEGMMLLAAFCGFVAALFAYQALGAGSAGVSLAVGVLAAVLSGGLAGAFHALLCVTYRVDQIISGTVVNVLAVGLTGYLNRALFFQGSVPPSPGVLPAVTVPLLGNVPGLGSVLQQPPITLAALALVALTQFVLFHTVWGLRTR